jgi:hypothetical protein
MAVFCVEYITAVGGGEGGGSRTINTHISESSYSTELDRLCGEPDDIYTSGIVMPAALYCLFALDCG